MKPRPVPIPISARATIASAGSGATSARPLNAIVIDEPDESGAPRAEAVGGASSRDLHREMGDEERRREQPDDREAHVVGVGELRRDRADVGDVPASGEADRAASEDRAPHAVRA